MSHVLLHITGRTTLPDGIIGMLGGVEVSRHHVNDAYGGYTTITMDMPDAPSGAHTMTPVFRRSADGKVSLAGIEYSDIGGWRVGPRVEWPEGE